MRIKNELQSSRDKRAKFVELANKRVNRALKDLGLVANLANRRNYEYDDEQVRKIIKALQSELEAVKHSFNIDSAGRGNNFEL
jgi:FKBP-type peptidyl-prolyl cis-trans isomerase (trigger factor)